MKNVQQSRIGRVAAAGLGGAMIAALSFSAVAPASAAVDPDTSYLEPSIYADEVSTTADDSAGWHHDSAPVTITDAGLALPGASTIEYVFPADYDRVVDYNLLNDVSTGGVTWTNADAIPTSFQISFAFGPDAQDVTTLTSAPGTVGKNTASSEQIWTTSGAIGSDFAAGSAADLYSLVNALVAQENEKVTGFGVTAFGADAVVKGMSWDGMTYSFQPGARLVAGTAELTGSPVVGSVLTLETAGWPAGTTFSYEWFKFTPGMGDGLENAGAIYTVTEGDVGYHIGVLVTGSKEGAGDATVRASSAYVTAPLEAAAPAPVADSSQLAAYLAAQGVTVETQTSTGLPAGALNPTASYTANLTWAAGDSFVDVYAYSAPVFVGSFAVVDGVAQINLSAKVLGQLAAGDHTLVAMGQSSGAVQAVDLHIAPMLAETGFDAAGPLTAAAVFLLLGGALVFVRRRHARA